MVSNVQNFSFTRYIYQNKFISNEHQNTFFNPTKMVHGDFDEFVLLNTIYPFGISVNKSNRLSIRITIEPYKGFNSKSKGAILYLQNDVPNNQDETGLRPTKFIDTYYGDFYKFNDAGTKIKDLVLCQILPQEKQLIIDVYYGYYPKNCKERKHLIDNHSWHKKSTR